MHSVRSLFISLGLFFASSSQAATTASDIHQVVDRFAAEYTAAMQQNGESSRTSYKVSKLDNRLSLADCPVELNTQLKTSGNNSRINVKVSCEQDKYWSVFVPVDIEVYQQVVIVTEPTARGSALQAHQLQLQEINTSNLRGSYYTSLAPVIGMETKRMLTANTTVLSNHLTPPMMIKKGDAVLVTASTATLKVKMPAVALHDGRQGQQIRVQNKRSKRTVLARVVAPGQVQVLM